MSDVWLIVSFQTARSQCHGGPAMGSSNANSDPIGLMR